MKREQVFVVGFLLAGVFLCGCADTKRFQSDLNRMQSELDSLRSVQAEQTATLSSVQSQVRTLSGRLDELEYSQKQRLGTTIDSLKDDISSLRKRVPPPPIVPADILENDEAQLPGLPREISVPMNDAFTEMRSGNFPRSSALLDDALAIALGTEWTPLILFWRSVSAEGQNDPQGALKGYLELVAQHPKHERVPVALLRQSSVLIRIGDKKGARLALNKLIASFPKTAEAARARERLKDL